MAQEKDEPHPVALTPTTNAGDGAPMSHRRKLAYALFVAAVAMVTASLIAEVVCRAIIPVPENYELVDDPILFYRLAAGVDTDENGVHCTHTKHHTRGPLDFAEEKLAGSHRVVWVGDSACFGCGVSDEETAPYRLHAMARDAGIGLESINLGVPGYNVAQVREVVAQRVAKLRGVDTVVYYHHQNDIVNAPWAKLAPFVPSGLYWKYERPGNPLIRCLKRSVLARRLGHTRLAAAILGRSTPGSTKGTVRPRTVESFSAQCASLYDDGGRHCVQFRDELFAMAADARGQGADFIVVYFPIESLFRNPQGQGVRRALSRWCADGGIGFIDVSEAFASSGEADLYADSIHPGRSGQQIVANAVFEYLVAARRASIRGGS